MRFPAAIPILTLSVLLVSCSSPSPLSLMRVTSSDFADQASMPSVLTCDGMHARPHLTLRDVPSGTQSLAIILHDPDAPRGEFIHWMAWNISPTHTDIPGDDPLAEAVQGFNGTGKPGYFGPCPPSGTHHYIFTVYALSSSLTLPATASVADLRSAVSTITMAEGTLTGLYSRSGSAASTSAEPASAMK